MKTNDQQNDLNAAFQQVEYWKNEAKRAAENRDKAKDRLNEAKQKLVELEAKGSLNDHLNKFIRDVPFIPDPNAATHDWLMQRVCEIENTDHIIVRMECNAAVIQLLRDMGMSLFTPASITERINSGLMGQLVELEIPVYLNNSLNKKIRFFIKSITLKPFEFPCEPPKQDFKDEISYAVDGIYGALGSCFPVSDFIVSDGSNFNSVVNRVSVRSVEEFASKMNEMIVSLLNELKAKHAISITYPQVFIIPDPKNLKYDVSICVPFSADNESHADSTVEDDKP
jgi:hypothetical protein